MTRFIRKRPVLSYVVLTFAISCVLGIPFNFLVSGMLRPTSLSVIYLPRLITVLGPAAAAIIVAGVGGGPIPLRHLRQSLRVPAEYRHWLLIIVFVGVAATLSAFRLAGLPLRKLFAIVGNDWSTLAAHLFVQVGLIGVGEELGWRGWLLPTLASERRFAAAAALTGLAWTLWHLPVFFPAWLWR